MKPLSPEETELWHAWKLANEAVMTRVGRDITEATGLSGADFGVLSRLEELGQGELRQQDLADSMRWDKSRLSHQLTRMEGRELIERRPVGTKGILVVLTIQGRKALAAARPVHAASIRRHLTSRIAPKQLAQLLATCKLLAEEVAP